MKQSLDQRLYNLGMSKKDLQKECANRGRKVGYDFIMKVLSHSNEVLYSTEKKITDTIQELEAERGISAEF